MESGENTFKNSLLQELEKLSNIKIDEEKKDDVVEYINEICHWFELLSSVDVSQIKEEFNMLTVFNDSKHKHTDNILLNKRTEHDYFVVPKVIETE